MKHYDELGNVIHVHHKQTPAAQASTKLGTGTFAPNAASDRNTLLPAYQSILKNPGYSDADKSAMTTSTLGGIGATYGAARDSAANTVARTNNSAGYMSTLDDLARSQGRETATAEAGLQSKFADTALSERDKALSGVSNLYGIDTSTMAKLLGIGTSRYGGTSFTGGIPGVAQVTTGSA